MLSPCLCPVEREASGATNASVRIGIYLPITGVDAPIGQSEYNAIKTAYTLKPVVLNKTIELHFFDTKSEENLASEAADTLIKKYGVHALIGGIPDDASFPGNVIAERAEIPVIYPIVTFPLTDQNNQYTFRTCVTDDSEAETVASFAYTINGARKAAIMMDISKDYVLNIANVFSKNFIEKGGRIVSAAYYQPEDKTFTEQISAIVTAKPDMLYLPNYPAEVALICKRVIEAKFNMPIFSSSKALTAKLIKDGEKSVEGIIVPGHFAKETATTDIAKRFITTYEELKEGRAHAVHALSADAYFVLVDAIERAQSLRGYDIRKALAQTKNFKAVSGTIGMDAQGNAVKKMVFYQVKNGKFEYVKPPTP
jgi:branched-chain amino acid transport system substrate-binding protein